MRLARPVAGTTLFNAVKIDYFSEWSVGIGAAITARQDDPSMQRAKRPHTIQRSAVRLRPRRAPWSTTLWTLIVNQPRPRPGS
jgi:hypothetical protein